MENMILRSAALALLAASVFFAQQKIVFSDSERPIAEQIKGLRAVPDAKRGAVTTQLALEIRALPAASPNKLMLASSLANLSTEGDFGKKTLQEVATTLADTLREQAAAKGSMPEEPYVTLAQLVRYEGAVVPMDDRLLNAAMARLQAEEQQRQKADFTLQDLKGKSWTLKDLRGKVVLVNFWATWCPPCRKEMPDLDALYKEFRDKGLVILAISDEETAKVAPFIAEHKYSYPILLDPGDKVNKMMAIEGIPKSFVYDREGKLVAQAIDMRTRGQLLEMLSRAGLK
jgi:peroxiredoxin